MNNDLISREAAIDAMLKLQAEDDEAYGCHIPEGFDGERAKEALEALPSAQPERKKGFWYTLKKAIRGIVPVILNVPFAVSLIIHGYLNQSFVVIAVLK